MSERGTVHMVGLGPGGKDLLTLRGAELLGRAQVVVHPSGVNDEILRLTPATAERLQVDPTWPVGPALPLLLAGKAREGRCVVRLVAGDPRADDRAAAEQAALQAAGVSCELVPGVSPQAVARPGMEPRAPALAGSLAGRRVVVTRSREQSAPLSSRLRERGAEVLEVPVIRLAPPDNKQPLADALLGLHEYDWLVFTSVNGVNTFFDYFFKIFHDLRDIGGTHIAAVGPVTAARLKELHLMVDAMPAEALGAKVARAMAEHGSLENLRICLLRAESANPELPRLLEEKGAIVDDIACYKTEAETADPDGAGARLQAGGADWVTFTSGSTVEHFHARFDLPELLRRFPGLRTASIGPETSKALTALSLKPDVEAREHTAEGLLKAIEKATSRRAPGAQSLRT